VKYPKTSAIIEICSLISIHSHSIGGCDFQNFEAQKLEPNGRLSTMILDDTLTPGSVVYVDRQIRNGKARNRGGSIAGVGSHFLGAWSSIHISIFHCQNTKLAAPWNSCLIHFIHSRELTYVTYPIQRAVGKMSFLSHLVGYIFGSL